MFGRKRRELEERVWDLENELELQHELNSELVSRLDQFESQQARHANALRELRLKLDSKGSA